MKPSQGQARGRRAIRGQDRCAACVARVHRDELVTLQRVREPPFPGELVVEIARKVVVGDEHVRFPAEAPPQRGARASTGAGQ